MSNKKIYLSYLKSIEILHTLNLKSQKEYHKWKKDNKITFLPSDPKKYYINSGWKSWGEWLGNDNKSFNNRTYISFDECKKYVKELNLKSKKDWFIYIKDNELPINIPKRPDHVYKNKGWICWGDFISRKEYSDKDKRKQFISYEEAVDLLKDLKLSYMEDYKIYILENNISHLPKRPDYFYKEKWSGWLNYLNSEKRLSKGECRIKKYLDVNKIKYKREFNVLDINARFDFYLIDFDILIEYDGIHHFEPVSLYGGDKYLKKTEDKDKIKNKWCIDNNKKLIRITYMDYSNIETILNKIFRLIM